MSAHTPGPWVITKYGYERYSINGRNGAEVAATWKMSDSLLLAAAPDSHDANMKFVEAIESLCNITPAWSDDRIYDELPSSGLALAYFAARAAIAKATGAQP